MNHLENLKFCLRVLDNILGDFNNPRFRRMNRSKVDDLIASELVQIGFEDNAKSLLILPNYGEGQRSVLNSHRQRIQALVDSLLDPESMSLAQVAEILARNGTLPGIDYSISDDPLEDVDVFSSESERPRKPWEIT
jgi:hypothetical protein